MGLREQLSLTQNGGVYYEGTRVTPTADPILFVGLGGTGIDALLRIKNEVQTRMPLPKGENGQIMSTSPLNISFLAMDTDKETTKKTFGVAGFEKTGDDFIDLSVDGLPMVIKSVVEKNLNEDEWSWYDRDLTANGGLDGANGIRQIGRFMLFQRVNDICDRFTRTIEKVLRAANSNSLKIFVLSGIGGGTGSGTFLDVAYLLRHLALEKTPNVQLHGYIFTPDLNKGNGGDNSSMYRNGFAALKELDYWMSAAEHQNPFVQKYNSKVIVRANARPFDYCHLITARDANHNLVDYSEAMNAVGGNLFSYIVSENVSADGNTALKQMYDNIAGHIVAAEKSYAANYNYVSIGSDKIEIPYTEITTLVAARVFARLEPVFQKAPTQETFGLDLRNLQLSPDHLWGYIHNDVMADPIQGQKLSYGDIWPSNAPFQRASQWLIHAQQVMRQNGANLASVREGTFRDYINALIKNINYGPCYAARMVQSNTSMCLVNTLEGFRTDCAERMATCSSKAGGLRNKLQQSFAAGSNVGVLGKSNAVREYTEVLTEWLGNEYAYWAYYELIAGLDAFIERLKKYYNRVFKNLQDSLCALPGIFEENVNKIIVDEQEARKNPEKARRYLIRPMEFENKYRAKLEQQVGAGAVAFLATIADNLKLWVGLELDEVDSDIMENTDIGGCIARFINDNFGDTLQMNMETLLLDRAPAGSNSEEFLRETLDRLKADAIPLYHLDVGQTNLDVKSFSIISIPNDCPKIYAIANRSGKPAEDGPKFSAERSRLQWVKVMAGLPLYAFPEVSKMEHEYERAMKTSRDTRKGVHLRWAWREELPSPLPESTWPQEIVNESQKDFAKEYNGRVRKAFDACVAAEIIRPHPNADSALLYIADESILDNLVLHGTIQEKKAKLEMVRKALWGNDATARRINPFGKVDAANLMERVCENNLRFYDIAQEIEKQAAIYERFAGMSAGFENVSFYINSIFANLIYDQGFETKFRRSALDYSPITLFDKMTQATYPDYDMYKGFCAILAPEIKENITAQFDVARRELIGADGNFNKEAVAAKVELLTNTKTRYAAAMQQLDQRIQQTPIDQRGDLIDTRDFYEKAIEIIDNNLRVFGA
ncbi:MAG: hypothetical protein E7450_05910 [Ruminococcaceae bacterium]|nr:hypothetical protein [Oscillospiraceae bacterium]